MIAWGLAAAIGSAIVAAFAPPLDVPLHYRIVDHVVSQSGEAVLETDATLRFREGAHGMIVSVQNDAIRIKAPPAQQAALTALKTPLIGVTTEAEVDRRGNLGVLVDADAPWAAWRASRQALLARIDAAANVPAATRAAGRAAILHDLDPASRDRNLRAAIGELLLPPSPPLEPGAATRIATTLPTPAGTISADSVVTLAAADPQRLTYRIETITAPGAGSTTMTFAETSELVIERASGLLLSFASHREARRAGVPPTPISRREIHLLR